MALPSARWRPGPEAVFLEGEFEDRISDAVQALPEKYREPIVLRHAADLSYEEIAEALELPIGTVKTRIFRAREALRRSLAELIENESPAVAGVETP